MRAKSAEFVTSATKPSGYPPEDLPEVAFAGRSNVGKSSLINKLVGIARLARTSQTPGRTRLLNWFRVQPPKGKPITFVDLPGYGYAKVSRSERDAWRPMVEAYLGGRGVLRAVVVIVDARRGAQQEEVGLLEWLTEAKIQAIVVLTKADKLPKSKRKPAAMAVKRELGLARAPIVFSATSGDGVDDLWRSITILAGRPPRQ
jgi:GTP-binding protein